MNSAVMTDRTKQEWIDLGTHTEACITQPETCGAAGGAISVWVNLIDYELGIHHGIITSTFDASSGLLIKITPSGRLGYGTLLYYFDSSWYICKNNYSAILQFHWML